MGRREKGALKPGVACIQLPDGTTKELEFDFYIPSFMQVRRGEWRFKGRRGVSGREEGGRQSAFPSQTWLALNSAMGAPSTWNTTYTCNHLCRSARCE
jgi:hypothetical protein